MGAYLLDTSIFIDVLNGKRGRTELLEKLLRGGDALACCAINVAEIYAGMHPREARATDALMGSLEYVEITWKIVRKAGRLRYQAARRGRTISLADAIIAAVAMNQDLALITDNVKHFRLPGLRLYPLE